jgi:archaeosine-15-forming tRNA-guanine transglycosylase
MAEIVPCLPFKMERELRQMVREGWRIHSVRGDTGYVLASCYGSGMVLRWNEKLEQLVKVVS